MSKTSLELKPEGSEGHQDRGSYLEFLYPSFEKEKFPWVQIWGYVGSLVLTVVALWLVMDHVLSGLVLLGIVLALAVVQAVLQLGVFMHLRESRGLTWQSLFLIMALFMAVGMVGMSIWIMTFKSGVS